MNTVNLLIADTSDDHVYYVNRALEQGGLKVNYQRVETANDVIEAVEEKQWDAILTDYVLPHLSAIQVLEILHKRRKDIPLIVVSTKIGEEQVVALMKAGAHDFVIKQNLARLAPVVIREIKEGKQRLAQRNNEESIRYLAYHDELTGLPNRVLLYDRLKQVIKAAVRNNGCVSVLYLDLDYFKEVNDSLGHWQGDELLQLLTLRLKQKLRESDTVARIGGDEFAIILPDTNEVEALNIANKIKDAVTLPFQIENNELIINVSIGVALFPDHGDEVSTLIQHADVAMYVAKRNKSGVCVYRTDVNGIHIDYSSLKNGLQLAIKDNLLSPHYQSRVDLRDGHTCGFEVFARWEKAGEQTIMPDTFIPMAEYFGLITPLSLSLIDIVLSHLTRIWNSMGKVKISINVSARTLNDPRFEKYILNKIDLGEVSPGMLEFEITESVMLTNPARTMALIQNLSSKGIEFSIDDFGKGYTSLDYLKRLPISTVKIDKSFVGGIIHDTRDMTIVKTIINLAHNFDFKVVAEGVENEMTHDLLSECGCDYAQGFFFDHPEPVEKVCMMA